MFSIIIPTYNRQYQLLDALNSLDSQSDKSFQVIIVDDYSDSVVSVNSSNYSYDVSVFRLDKNLGAAGARNYGVSKAKYEWIIFLDDDDIMHPNKIQYLKDEIKKFNFDLYSHGIKVIVPSLNIKYMSSFDTPSNPSKTILVRNFIGGASRVLIKKNVFLDCGGFDTKLRACEDYDLWIRVCQKYKVKISSEILLDYISDVGSSALSKNLIKNIEARNVIYEKNANLYFNAGFKTIREYHHYKNAFFMNICVMNNSKRYIYYAFLSFLYSFKFKYIASVFFFTKPTRLIRVRGKLG